MLTIRSTLSVRGTQACTRVPVWARTYRATPPALDKYGNSFKSNRDDSRYGGHGGFGQGSIPGGKKFNLGNNISADSDPAAKKDWVRLSFTPTTVKTPQEVATWRAENEISITGNVKACPDPILEFSDAPFPPAVIATLSKKFEKPLAIQSQGWSMALSGVNMVGCADTGSGKTVGFLLPCLEHFRHNADARGRGPASLIVAPTRELAQQIEAEAAPFLRAYGTTTACLFGGQGTRAFQIRQLTRNPGLVIATPGRLLDLVDAGFTDISGVSMLVLDEADRMLDMGFGEDIRQILDRIQPDRQTCMWSATWPKSVSRLATEYFSDYVRVNVGSNELTANPRVTQLVEVTSVLAKIEKLKQFLDEHPESKTLIFSSTKIGCDTLGSNLYSRGLEEIATLHGDKSQSQRDNILKDFKSGVLKCVIATDVASRGLDVKDIDFVINYDFPNDIETYIHRIGRTARAGRTGTAITYFTEADAALASDLIDVLKEAKQEVPSELIDLKNRRGGRGGNSRGGRGGNSRNYGGSRGGSGGYGGFKHASGGSDRGFGGDRSIDDLWGGNKGRASGNSRSSRGYGSGSSDFGDRGFGSSAGYGTKGGSQKKHASRISSFLDDFDDDEIAFNKKSGSKKGNLSDFEW
eukprot:TRINITY_DN2177_c0_g2_i2.p1 TRINITY_DN2177_c0_g2~~TRINITY_DN2177_c0_g2_i2.p1  ORF type:complete len:636 (-),score=160.68 TRINITY_DN2177_c0_g2_i2:55-1962(-)